MRARVTAASARSSVASVRTSRHSGITNARTTADVVAATNQPMRAPHGPVPSGAASRTPTPRTVCR